MSSHNADKDSDAHADEQSEAHAAEQSEAHAAEHSEAHAAEHSEAHADEHSEARDADSMAARLRLLREEMLGTRKPPELAHGDVQKIADALRAHIPLPSVAAHAPESDDPARNRLEAKFIDVKNRLREHNEGYSVILERVGRIHDQMLAELAELHKDVERYNEKVHMNDKRTENARREIEGMVETIRKSKESMQSFLETVLQSVKTRMKSDSNDMKAMAHQAELELQLSKSIVDLTGKHKIAADRMKHAEQAHGGDTLVRGKRKSHTKKTYEESTDSIDDDDDDDDDDDEDDDDEDED